MTLRMKPKRTNSRMALIIIIVLLIIAVTTPVVMYNSFLNSPASDRSKAVQLKITKGMTSDMILDLLTENGLLKNKLMAKLRLKLSGDGAGFKAGVYKFDRNMTPLQIFDMLKQHDIDKNYVRFTIPEGYSIQQIADKLVSSGLIDDTEQLYRCLRLEKFNYSFLNNMPKGRLYGYEGYLFPDTYEFEKGMTVKYMVNEMLGRFDLVYSRLKTQFAKSNRSIDELVIIASMIEKEAIIDLDRPKIASVIYNRLKIGMRLQIDATVQYALPEHKSRLLLNDLKIDSPYNTYKFKGLPEGPISNPGQKSIEAALSPEKSNYIYYLAKRDGSNGHFFTDSYKEFLRIKNSGK